MNDVTENAVVMRRQSLEASVIRACRKCGSPGFYHNVSGVNVACYDPSRLNQPVGNVCPGCGSEREVLEDLGEIWRREPPLFLRIAIRLHQMIRSLSCRKATR